MEDLEWHLDDAQELEPLCDAVCRTLSTPDAVKAFRNAGGMVWLTEVLKRHIGNATVAGAACSAIQVASKYDYGHPSSQHSAGASSWLIEVLRRHLSVTAVVTSACRALVAGYENDRSKAELLTAGVNILLKVLEEHGANEATMSAACDAISVAIRSAGDWAAFGAGGGMLCLSDLLLRYGGSAAAVTSVCKAVKAACAGHAHNGTLFKAADGMHIDKPVRARPLLSNAIECEF